MAVSRKVQGRTVTDKDIKTIQSSIVSNPTWQRIRISQELCQLWNWKNDAGKPKDIAARAMLRKLDNENLIDLPAPVRSANNTYRYLSKQEEPKVPIKSVWLYLLSPLYNILTSEGLQL